MKIQFILLGKRTLKKVNSLYMIKHSSFFKNCIIFLVAALLSFSSSTIIHAQEKCLSHIIRDQQNEKDPRLKRNREIIAQQVQEYINNNPNAREAAQVTIPVVFQVIHNGDAVGTGENLSDAQLMQQLNQLNADYARMNTDANMTPAAFQGVAANTMIQFCLATMDPNGQPTTGIVRTNLALDQNACWNAAFITTNIVNGRAWNTANYLNIFTVLKIATDDCSSNSILGYATFPGEPAATDVAVHAYYTIGSLASPNPDGGAVGMGRTVTHEVGHWLMLEHIWFDPGCGTDDGVADTPPQDSDSNGCPPFPTTDACTPGGNGIMFMNYMDYVDDNCMNMFTQGQATRMLAAINASRQGLLNSQCGMNPGNDGYTCANAIEITQPGTFNAPGPDQGNGAIAGGPGTHANWYRFTPPMTGMIRIFTCGLAGAGNQHNHVYTVNTGSCATLDINDVIYTEDRGCTQNQADGVKLEDVPVTAGVPIYIEWDDALSSNPFTWTLEYQGGVGCMANETVSGATMGNTLASNSITTQNAVSVNGAAVFSAPNVNLNGGFEVPLGNCFEANNVGCAYNGVLMCGGGGGATGTCASPHVITCGQVFQGNNTGGESNWSSYDNGNYTGLTGPEKIHSLVIPANTTRTITLSGLNADLDLLIATVCNDPQSVSIVSDNGGTNDEMVMVPNNSPNPVTFYIIVDGFGGATSPYSLSCN